jgi:ribosomal protein S18 acetylase RimI-like enzyme
MIIRPYAPADWASICRVHDEARKHELAGGCLSEAFLSLPASAESEGLFDGEVLVLEDGGAVLGFVAYNDEELTWLYVAPSRFRQGLGRRLVRAALAKAGRPLSLEVLQGNEAALSLYLSEGFRIVRKVSGHLSGNEDFPATAHVLHHPNDGS